MFWIVLLALIFICGAGIYLFGSYDYCGVGIAMATTTGAILFIAMIIWPLSYMGSVSMVNEYQALKITIETSRANEIDPLERATIQKEIIGMNKKVQNAQFWNTHGFDPMHTDKIMQLELLK